MLPTFLFQESEEFMEIDPEFTDGTRLATEVRIQCCTGSLPIQLLQKDPTPSQE